MPREPTPMDMMLDEGLDYEEMARRGYAPIEYRAYIVKKRKRPFQYVVMPVEDMIETTRVIERLRARIKELENAGQ